MKYHSTFLRASALASVVAGTLALTACGGGEDSAANASTASASDAGTASVASTTGGTAKALAIVPIGGGGGSAVGYILSPLPKLVNTLRQIYVDPSNPKASDSNSGLFGTPLKTLAAAVATMKPGDDIIVGQGVYREQLTLPAGLAWGTLNTVLRAAVPGSATINGSDLIGGWAQINSDTWAVAWSGDEPEQVYRNGTLLKQIGGTVFGGFPNDPKNPLAGLYPPGGIWPGRVAGDKNSLQPNSFTYDASERKVYVRLSSALASGEKLEVSTRQFNILATAINGLTIDGMVFDHANTSFTDRHGAVNIAGNNNKIQNTTIRNMDSFCVQMDGDNNQLVNSTLSNCGQAGVSASGHYATISGNNVTNSNTRGFYKSWEAGGMKFTGGIGLIDSTVSNNTVTLTNGDAIWFDWTPERVVISGNTTAYNTGHGIHFEASTAATITNNISYGNGQRGIYLLESTNSSISSNIAFGNTNEGIAIANGVRSGSDPSLLPYGNSMSSNTSAWNDAHGNRIQIMLPGLSYTNTSNKNRVHSPDVVPRYTEDWVSSTNPYKQGLPAWTAYSGQDTASKESYGAMPSSLSSALAAKKMLTSADLPPMLQVAGCANTSTCP